jgi:hypothetical protein
VIDTIDRARDPSAILIKSIVVIDRYRQDPCLTATSADFIFFNSKSTSTISIRRPDHAGLPQVKAKTRTRKTS